MYYPSCFLSLEVLYKIEVVRFFFVHTLARLLVSQSTTSPVKVVMHVLLTLVLRIVLSVFILAIEMEMSYLSYMP
jgi:hypothetical protein